MRDYPTSLELAQNEHAERERAKQPWYRAEAEYYGSFAKENARGVWLDHTLDQTLAYEWGRLAGHFGNLALGKY